MAKDCFEKDIMPQVGYPIGSNKYLFDTYLDVYKNQNYTSNPVELVTQKMQTALDVSPH